MSLKIPDPNPPTDHDLLNQAAIETLRTWADDAAIHRAYGHAEKMLSELGRILDDGRRSDVANEIRRGIEAVEAAALALEP